jgi:murein DD-endopeptidase MepM/ murein hydrolase activator NlpD
MLRGPGRRAPSKTILAVSALLGAFAAGTPAASAATSGGASIAPTSSPASRVAKPVAAPALAPVAQIPQLAAAVSVRRIGRRAASAATLSFVSHARGPLAVRVDVVRLADGMSVFTQEQSVAPEAPQKLTWSGRATSGLALDGRYEFRLSLDQTASGASVPDATAVAGGAAPQSSPPPPGSAAVGRFTFLGAIFPVRGKHDFGGAAGRFGAGRTGHVHQGQDVMADCGTPLVAARGGIVKARASQSAAGNYVVIHDPVSGQDYFYAHLRSPAIVKPGQRVATGQPIGVVGETGDATACHLHFEIWTAPGWYAGGQPIDPLATLERWDRVS